MNRILVLGAIILGILFLTSMPTFGQQRIVGRIIEKETRLAVIAAQVYHVNDPSKSTLTDESGIFKIYPENFPFTIRITYVGFKPIEIVVDSMTSNPYMIELEEETQILEGVVIKGQRISEKQKAAPQAVESIDLLSIKETPSVSFYNSLGNLKGVDLTTASLGFTIINTRGFNSTSPVRSLQLIDGVDNQAPGLNFSLGNFLGVSELDILKVDLIAGASSTLFGPNAFNGVINMETKSPFFHKGLSASLKVGERNLFEGALRWADVIKNKKGDEYLGYKLNFFRLQANDWEAENYSAVDGTSLASNNPGGYDAVNTYGDETNFRYYNSNLNSYKGMENWTRTGYKEVDLVDYNTKNTKANAAIHLRTKPSLGITSPELIISSSFGSGTTVYQGENRFSLKNIKFFQNKLEFRKKDKYFIRAYTTHEDAGDSYDPYFTALQLQREAHSEERWIQNFYSYWGNYLNRRVGMTEYPGLEVFDSIQIGGVWYYKQRIDPDKYANWKNNHLDSLNLWYQEAKNYADNVTSPANNEVPFFEPGTERFQQKFDEITSSKSNDKGNKLGSKFFDKSALYHIAGEYKLTPSFAEVTLGGSARFFRPNSDGTIFYDTASTKISTYEYGVYGGLEKKFFNEKLTGNLALRVDKNKNFDVLLSPAASLVFKPAANNFIRLSFSSAIRNPTLTDQFLNLNVGPAILVGNLSGADSVITVESFRDYITAEVKDKSLLSYYSIDPIRPEKVKTIETGIRTTLFDQVYMDAGYYFNFYEDFIGYKIGIKSTFDPVLGSPVNMRVYRYAANSTQRVTTQGFNIGLNYFFANYYMISGNYSWNKLNTIENDPIIPAFNTPEHKYNLSFSCRDLPLKKSNRNSNTIGFNVTYKWVKGFLFEGSPQFTGFIPSYELVDAQISMNVLKINTIFKLGSSNLLNNKVYQTYGGPLVGRLAYLSVVYTWNKN